jgi:deoxyribodipyrimidine photo-lyase
MQTSQRVNYNHGLTYSIDLANRLNLPLLVFFGLTEDYPEANLRHYKFMLQGLAETFTELKKRKIKLVVWMIDPVTGVKSLSENASAVITDFGYLKIHKEWRAEALKCISKRFVAVESDVIVPVRAASGREEYTAGTFRPHIMKLFNLYLNPVKELKVKHSSLEFKITGIDLSSPENVLEKMKIDRSVPPVDILKGGSSCAYKHLNSFIKKKLDEYQDKRNNPSLDFSSHLSPYLHFGQISPVYIAMKILGIESPGRDAFLEELVVRRELSVNFVYYNHDYDNMNCLPEWALKTLIKHEKDDRETIYSKVELEKAMTSDPYWNAAQNELVRTGTIHNYMRMYWGKKIIQWTEGPDDAFEHMVYLNNRYALDGRDPNSYAGIAWCLGKHDRPWKERPVFGKIRYMNDRGLLRKFDMSAYLKKNGVLK